MGGEAEPALAAAARSRRCDREKLASEFWPGAPIIPVMSAGGTTGAHLRSAGMATYGHSGMAIDVSENRLHGRDERVPVKSFYEGTEYLYRLVKVLAGGK